MVWCFGGLLSIPQIMYAGMCRLFNNRKETEMKPLHPKEHIFNLDAVVMIEPYDDGGLVHCTDNHAYRISEAEYQELRTLLRKEVLNREVKHPSSSLSKPNHENGS